MSGKLDKMRSSRIKILNDEKINATPALPLMTSVPLSPPKQLTMSIAKSQPAKKTTDSKMDHYVMHTIKGETDEEGYVGDSIDFILTDNDGEEKTFGIGGPSGEITEELHLSGEEMEEGDEQDHSDMKTEEIIEHVCGKCYKTFRSVKSLKKHLDFCRFDSGYHLRKAEMLKNLEKIEKDAEIMEKKDICFCCGESYDTFHLGHISCPDCPKSFKSQSSYERHIFITHSEFNDYPCTICNAKLRSENLLKLHIEQHQNRGKPFACKICGRDFTRSYHLKRHQKYSSCSGDQGDAMSCKVCNKSFFRLDNLRAHLKQHLGTHTTKKSEYMCPICKNCFYSLSTLNIHTRSHTGERPFDCDLCDKKFPSLVALKKHRRYHTGERPYTCTVCSQSFAVKEVLNRHMKRHTGERPHVCSECNKSFIQATQLRNHLRTHLRPYECSECTEKFKTEKQLERHAKSHKVTSRKGSNFDCSICSMRFKTNKNLLAHISNKHKEKPINKKTKRTDCAICEKNFDTVKNLEFHILKVHEVDPEEFINEKPPQEDEIIPAPKIIKLEDNKTNELFDEEMEYFSSKLENNEEDNGVVVQEFIVDELPTSSNSKHSIFLNPDAFTVIPLDSHEAIETVQKNAVEITNESKGNIRKSLAESLAAAIADEDEEMEEVNGDVSNAEDEHIKENVSKLLDMLVDKETLTKFGWPENSVENVLCKVIENCGHDLSKSSENYKNCDFATRMREYVKLLFTVVIHNDSIEELLNNYPIDEVIEYVLGNDENDDEDVVDDNATDASASEKS